MILIGQYDSPFVRRVGIALTLYDMPFVHRPWSVFGDAEKIAALNPLCRVPTLVLEDGAVLTDSHMALDHLDSRVDAPLFPRAEPARHAALRVATLACGLAEKAVSLFYEHRLHGTVSEVWVARCTTQIRTVAAALEAEFAARETPFWFGTSPGHADIALACALRFAGDAHPGLIDMKAHPRLAAHAARLEATDAFRRICQPFIPPA
jgi:glutathione S-transferase